MNYQDLTTFQTSALATKKFMEMARRNVIDQQKNLEKMAEMDSGQQVRYESDIVDEVNSISGYLRSSQLAINEIQNLFTYKNTSGRGSERYLTLRDTSDITFFTNFTNMLSKLIGNIEAINDGVGGILDEIRNVGPEIFDFAQLSDMYKLYEKFRSSFNKYSDFFDFQYNVDGSINDSSLRKSIEITSKNSGFAEVNSILKSVNSYIEEIASLSGEIIKSFEDIISISRERGSVKISGYGKIPQRFL